MICSALFCNSFHGGEKETKFSNIENSPRPPLGTVEYYYFIPYPSNRFLLSPRYANKKEKYMVAVTFLLGL